MPQNEVSHKLDYILYQVLLGCDVFMAFDD